MLTRVLMLAVTACFVLDHRETAFAQRPSLETHHRGGPPWAAGWKWGKLGSDSRGAPMGVQRGGPPHLMMFRMMQ
ncbi:MAG: hypothetical protein ACPHJ3_18215, partial [Rubripirellula sp.]